MGDKIVIWREAPGSQYGFSRVEPAGPVESLNQATRRLPGGAYTTFRTFSQKRVFRMEDHYHRLEETAALAGKPIKLDRARVRELLRVGLADFPYDLARVRLILDLEDTIGAVYLLLEELHVPGSQAYDQGVKVVTRRMKRENPKAKLTHFIEKAAAVQQNLQPGINEALMVGEDGRVLEGLSSNFFGVRNGTIWTAEEGVLSGITRSLVLEVISEQGMPLKLKGVRVEDLPALDEAFITSASRAVLPVMEIDGLPVGEGKPGPVSKKLLQGYLERVESELELVE